MNKVEFNLLPDQKMNVVKAGRMRNTIVSIAFVAAVASLALFILLFFTVNGVQRKQLSDANKDIETANNTLKGVSSLEQILTVQNQLKTLTGLHQNKHVSSRLISYLPQVTPTNVSIGSLTVDMAVNTFIDTLKFTTYTTSSDSSAKSAFPTVIETNFALSGGGKVSYLLDVNYDPVLFSNSQAAPTLHVPSLTTTRSVTDNPSNQLFTGQPAKQKENQ